MLTSMFYIFFFFFIFFVFLCYCDKIKETNIIEYVQYVGIKTLGLFIKES